MTCEYHPQILHNPENSEGAILAVKDMLNYLLKLEITDGRIYEGVFTAFDKFGNFVLTDSKEMFRDQIRPMPMVIVPLKDVKCISKMKAPEKKEEEKCQ